ncbi:hypothetical protein EYC84_008213 [Monilinia fructicola]|uniref:Uncharacterized protein n=1 Tax=Monilinia fructicola TaxID=38448 RepID=A0A5M9JHC7_MONFR|nr:hypothetical protein EYC84_008213 [Monilinia fructicola]
MDGKFNLRIAILAMKQECHYTFVHDEGIHDPSSPCKLQYAFEFDFMGRLETTSDSEHENRDACCQYVVLRPGSYTFWYNMPVVLNLLRGDPLSTFQSCSKKMRLI